MSTVFIVCGAILCVESFLAFADGASEKTFEKVEAARYRFSKAGVRDTGESYIVFEAEESSEVENELCIRKYFEIELQPKELDNFEPGFVQEVKLVESCEYDSGQVVATHAIFSTHDREYKVTRKGVEYI